MFQVKLQLLIRFYLRISIQIFRAGIFCSSFDHLIKYVWKFRLIVIRINKCLKLCFIQNMIPYSRILQLGTTSFLLFKETHV